MRRYHIQPPQPLRVGSSPTDSAQVKHENAGNCTQVEMFKGAKIVEMVEAIEMAEMAVVKTFLGYFLLKIESDRAARD